MALTLNDLNKAVAEMVKMGVTSHSFDIDRIGQTVGPLAIANEFPMTAKAKLRDIENKALARVRV